MERPDDDQLRFRSLAGRVLDRSPDPLLEAIVRDAARETGAKIAVVALVLEHTVMFRAHHGLPTDFAVAGGIDRDACPCTVVVHDRAPFMLNLVLDEPGSLAVALEVRAYAGVPIRIHNVVVGALGVFAASSTQGFDSDVLHVLDPIARRVSARLEERAAPTRRLPRLRSRAGSPAFGEVQVAMAPLRDDVIYARVLAADAAPMARIAAAGIDCVRLRSFLSGAVQASMELTAVLADVERASRKVEDEVALVEAAIEDAPGPSDLTDVVAFADGLARHATRYAGGVHWENAAQNTLRDIVLRATRTVAAGVLAAALSDIAHRQRTGQGMVVDVQIDPQAVTMALCAEISPEDALDCASTVAELLGAHPSVRVNAVGDAVVVRFVRAWDA